MVGGAVSVLRCCCTALARRLARRAAGRHRARHVDAAGGVSGRADGIHGDGRVADLARARADAPRCRDRNARLGDGAVYRQDRHADGEPDVDRRAALARRRDISDRAVRSAIPRRCFTSIVDFGDARECARARRSDGEGDSTNSARRTWLRGALPRRGWTLAARLWPAARSARDVARVAAGPTTTTSSSRRRARRRRSPICVALDAAPIAPRSRTPSMRWPPTDCGCSASRARRSRATRCRESQRDFAFEFVGLIGLADPLRPSVPAAVARMPFGRHPRRDDHRRLSGDRARDRAPGRSRRDDLVSGERTATGSTTPSWRQRVRTRDGIRADHAGAEAAHRQRAEGATAKSSR